MTDQRCTCGCSDRSPGFDQLGRGAYKGRGAGYTLLQRVDRWDVLDANGEAIRDLGSMPRTLDEANTAATLYARRAGHGHA